jgi:histidinol dehydrogenase
MRIFKIENDLTFNLKAILPEQIFDLLQRNNSYDPKISKDVESIISRVRADGDEAILQLSNQFDKANFLSSEDFLVSKDEFFEAEKLISPELIDSFKISAQRIKFYHQQQMPADFNFVDQLGFELGNHWQAIQKLGVYVPGGSASYPSSVLMSVIPAQVAGVEEIVVCVPTNNSKINPAVLYACKFCGIDKVYKIGGAQAISALAFGTKKIPKVDKIVGPGNSYVALAKKQLYGEVGIDMIAGPTDLTIVADNTPNPTWLAIDALSQLEHGEDSKAFIIVDNFDFAQKINDEIAKLKPQLTRKNIIEKSLTNSAIFVINNISQAHFLVNFIAPEHLQIVTLEPEKILAKIKNSGAIFTGQYCPEAIGDYVAGPSHTLPTSGTSRFASGLSVYDFLKRQSLIKCDKNSFFQLAKPASLMAEAEGLTAHQLSIDIRKL